MLLSELLSSFLHDRARTCVPRIVKWYSSHLSLLVAWLFERNVVEAHAVTRELLEQYIADLRSRERLNRGGKLSPVTIGKQVAAFKTFFAWAVAQGLLVVDPAAAVVMPKVPRRLPKALTSDQIAQLFAVDISVRDRAILYLFLDSGLRLSELAALDLADIDLQRGLVHVRHGKGDKERWGVFAEQTRQALEAWLIERARVNGHSARLFVGSRGALSSMGCYKIVKRIAARAGLYDAVSPHRLRHTFATTYLDGEGSVVDLKELLGHTDIRTTMVYVSVSLERLRQKHAKFSPLNRLSIG